MSAVTRKASVQHEEDSSAAGNARLTGTTGAILLLLFCVEVATVVMGVWGVLTLHVMIATTILSACDYVWVGNQRLGAVA